MVPNVNPRGQSFKGVAAYLLYGEKGQENPDRVAWTSTGNLYTDDIEKAAAFMAWTDMEKEHIRNQYRQDQGLDPVSSGAKPTAGNVYHYSLSWRDDQTPEQGHMEETVVSSLERLGLSEHQYLMVAHDDTDHAHVHVVVNLVHPETGKAASVYRDHKKLDRWAHEYEQEHGVVCEDRAKKYEAWERGDYQNGFEQIPASKTERAALYREQLTEAYQQSDSSVAFIHAMQEHGLELSLKTGSRRGFVFVDGRGDVFGLTRHIDGANTKDVTALLKDVDASKLTSADELAQQRKAAFEEYQRQKDEQPPDDYNREEEEVKRQLELEKAALRHAENQAFVEERQAQIFEKLQIDIKIDAREQWQEIKDRQSLERQVKEKQLREADSPREARARAYYQPIIDQYQQHKESLANLNQSWFQRTFYRFRHGQSVDDAIADKQKSIADARSRLEASTGKLTADDVRKLKELQRTHQEQRESLRKAIDKELQDAYSQAQDKARDELDDKVLQQAETDIAALDRLSDHFQPKTDAQQHKLEELKSRFAKHKADQLVQAKRREQQADKARKEQGDRDKVASVQAWLEQRKAQQSGITISSTHETESLRAHYEQAHNAAQSEDEKLSVRQEFERQLSDDVQRQQMKEVREIDQEHDQDLSR